MRWRSDVIQRHLWRVRRLTCNNSIAYLKNWTDNFFQIFFMGTSWVAVSINNITTRASSEMTSRKNIKIFYFNGVNVAKHWHVAGEVFAISDCLVTSCVLLVSSDFTSIIHKWGQFVPNAAFQSSDVDDFSVGDKHSVNITTIISNTRRCELGP